jgi:endonuclease/exonuclease/phosphatase (EEP) superfamily protein YafD
MRCPAATRLLSGQIYRVEDNSIKGPDPRACSPRLCQLLLKFMMRALLASVLSRPVLPLLVAAAALLAFAAGYLSSLSALLDFSAQFSAHWLVLAVVAVVASFVQRYAYTILASSLLIAALAPPIIASWYSATHIATTGIEASASVDGPVNPPKPAKPPRQFKLLTFNVYNLNNDLEAIWSEIVRHDADVLLLIEFGPSKQGLLPRLLERYPHGKSCVWSWSCAIGLYSRLPMQNFKLVAPNDDAGPALIAADIELAGGPVTIIGTHVLSPNHGPRANFIELDHLGRRARESLNPVVVAGDLNTTVWANAFDNFRRKSGLIHMGHLIPTWPMRPLPLPQLGIDHVFASPELRMTGIRAGKAAGSDHLPLVATIEPR